MSDSSFAFGPSSYTGEREASCHKIIVSEISPHDLKIAWVRWGVV